MEELGFDIDKYFVYYVVFVQVDEQELLYQQKIDEVVWVIEKLVEDIDKRL